MFHVNKTKLYITLAFNGPITAHCIANTGAVWFLTDLFSVYFKAPGSIPNIFSLFYHDNYTLRMKNKCLFPLNNNMSKQCDTFSLSRRGF